MNVPELTANYHRAETRRRALDRRIQRLPQNDIAGRDSLLAELDTVVADLHTFAGQLATISAHDLNELCAKARVLTMMQDCEAEVLAAFSRRLAGDIMKVSKKSIKAQDQHPLV